MVDSRAGDETRKESSQFFISFVVRLFFISFVVEFNNLDRYSS